MTSPFHLVAPDPPRTEAGGASRTSNDMNSLANRLWAWMSRTSLVKSRRMHEPSLTRPLSSDEVGTDTLVPRIVEGVETSRLGDDFVVVDGDGRMLRGLSPTGARVFELMNGSRSTGEIASSASC